jgi:uncharacterized membrane protein YjjP (DUF1212 family)
MTRTTRNNVVALACWFVLLSIWSYALALIWGGGWVGSLAPALLGGLGGTITVVVLSIRRFKPGGQE